MDMQEASSLDVNGHETRNEAGDSKAYQRKQPNTPYALHVGDNKENTKDTNKAASENSESANTENPKNLKAPYAQPVLDASKLKRSNVDERIALVRERRMQNQQAFGNPIVPDHNILEREANIRKVKDELALAKWEQSQNERRKKMEENKDKEDNRRKEVELRKKQRLDEDKKKAEAIVARTDQQATVVLRRKRTASTDRTKRWSWGAGGYGGGGGGVAYATSVDTAPGPFHYLDANRMTKHQPSSGLIGSARSQVVTSSCFDLSQLTDGDDDKPSSSSTTTGPFGFGSPSASSGSQQQDSRFSKSPLLLSTAHMTFASGLRSYDSSPVSNSSKPSSPASTPRSMRSRSSDTRTKSRKGCPQGSVTGVDGKLPKNSPRGRSPAARQSESLKRPKAGNNLSPQLTEPVSLSSRLLAPTRASLARSKQADSEESTHVRSRSIDRKATQERPTSARSDISSSSSHSPGMSASTTPKSRPIGRTPSPSLHKARSSKSDVHSSSSPNLAQTTRGESPQLRTGARRAPSPASGRSSLNSQSSSGKSSRGVSPARQSPISSRPSSSGSKRTPIRTDTGIQSSKSTPPVIKQTLRPSPASTRPKSSFSPSIVTKSKSEKKDKVPSKSKPKQPAPKLTISDMPSDKPEKPKVQQEGIEKPPVKENQADAAVCENLGENTEKVKIHQVPVHIPNADNQVEKGHDSDAPEVIQQTADAPVVVSQEETHEDVKNAEVQLPTAFIASEVASSEVSEEQEVHLNVHDDEAPTAPTTQDLGEESTDFENLVSTPSTERLEEAISPAPATLYVEEKSSNLGNLESPSVERLDHDEIENLTTQETANDAETEEKSPLEVQKIAESALSLESRDVQEVHQSENYEPIRDENQQDKEQEPTQLEDSLDEEDLEQDTSNPENDKIATNDEANIVSSSPDNDSLTPSVNEDQREEVLPESTQDLTDICAIVNDDKPEAQGESSPVVEISPEIVETPAVQPVEPAPVPAETKKKEKKLTPEEQAYKEAMATKRREAKEKREKEELERQERKKLEAEERNRRVEIARQMAEEARLEEEKRVEEEQKKLAEERRLQEEEELKKKLELEEQNRKHEEFLREQKEKIEQRAKEEAEKARKEREASAQKKEEERLQRKKRLEMIMRRTRGGESPTPGATNSNSTPSGDSSPANVTPTGGRSPLNSITPDRVVSPVTVESPPVLAESSSNHTEETHEDNPQAPISAAHPMEDGELTEASEIPTIEMPPASTTVDQSVPSPVEAFENTAPNEEHQFVPSAEHNGKTFDALLNCDKAPMNGTDGENHAGFVENPFVKVPTGNLVEL